jgi:hypothetical protein
VVNTQWKQVTTDAVSDDSEGTGQCHTHDQKKDDESQQRLWLYKVGEEKQSAPSK